MTDQVPLSPTQLTFYRTIEKSGFNPDWQRIVRAFAAHGQFDLARFRSAVADLCAAHPILLARINTSSPVMMTVVGLQAADIVTLTDLRGLPDDEFSQQLSLQVHSGPDWADQLPLRVIVASRDDHDTVLVFVFHHLFVDVKSVQNLVAAVFNFYDGKEQPHPGRPVSYYDYVFAQQKELRAKALTQRLAYWSRLLSDCGPTLPISEHPAGRSPRVGLTSHLTQSQTSLIRSRARSLRIGAFSLFVSSLRRILSDVTAEAPTLSLVHDLRRGQFLGTAGMFSDFIFLPPAQATNLPTSHELVGTQRSILEGMAAALPCALLKDHVDWMAERWKCCLHPGEIIVNFINLSRLAAQPATSGGCALSRYHVPPPPDIAEPYVGTRLELAVAETDTGFITRWLYRDDLLHADQVARLGERLTHVIMSYCAA